MGCRKKWILLVATFLVFSSSTIIFFGNLNSNKPVIYQPREVKIKGIHVADI